MLLAVFSGGGVLLAQNGVFSGQDAAKRIRLPTSKEILSPVPGAPQRLNSLPMAAAWSPDHRYLAMVNAGFGTLESGFAQSIAVLDAETGKLKDFPEQRVSLGAPQTLYAGIVFSADGKHLYVSMDSLGAPEGGKADETGNAIAVYRFAADPDGAVSLAPEKLIPIPLQTLRAGEVQHQFGKPIAAGKAIPAPAGLALVPAGNVAGNGGRNGQADRLLVADNFSDDVLLVDAGNGSVLRRFDLSAQSAVAPVVVPSTYPIAVAASADGRRAYVALWNGSAVAELNLETGGVMATLPLLAPAQSTDPSSHPTALVLSPDGQRLYVALANRDAVAVVKLRAGAMTLGATLDTRLPGQSYFGAMPDALALSPDGGQLYVANSGSDAVAVFSTREKLVAGKPGLALGFVPTEWYPTLVAVRGDRLYVATAKGKGTGRNDMAQMVPEGASGTAIGRLRRRPNTYIATLLHGSLASVDLSSARRELPELTQAVVESNRMAPAPAPAQVKAQVQVQVQVKAQPRLTFSTGANPIRHVIYIIRENRTYDQLLGDLSDHGERVGDGDPGLTMYGEAITPNLHRLALQFGVLDNFYDSGEVSGDGHVWSTAAITSDYTEKTWQQSYRGRERPYDYEGVVEQGYPLLDKIPDVDEPQSGYLWTDLARHGKSLYHFGEFVSTKFCDDSGEAPKDPSPLNGTPEPKPEYCAHPAIDPGAAIPANYGGGLSRYAWKIPLIYKNVATKPELEGHFDPDYPDFNLSFPDQLRFEEFDQHFRAWVSERDTEHKDAMPAFVMLRFPNDHTAGTTPGMPTPRASVADNDLAVGRTVEAISHSSYWADTAIFVLEDDAQDGGDHVDAHRSIALVVSKYAPREARPVVDHHFYTTVSVLRTIEELLGVPPMNNNDAFAPAIAPLFAGHGDQPMYEADYRNRNNGLIYTANTKHSPGAKESSRMDFTHEDRADAQKLNAILWRDARGNDPMPATLPAQPLRASTKKRKDNDGN